MLIIRCKNILIIIIRILVAVVFKFENLTNIYKICIHYLKRGDINNRQTCQQLKEINILNVILTTK